MVSTDVNVAVDVAAAAEIVAADVLPGGSGDNNRGRNAARAKSHNGNGDDPHTSSTQRHRCPRVPDQ